MRLLALGEGEKEMIRGLRDHAESNPITNDQMLKLANGLGEPIGDNPNFQIQLPVGYKIVYSEEFHKNNLMRHMSVSVDAKDKWPHPVAIGVLMEEFGFKGTVFDIHPFTSIYKEEEFQAINVIQKK